LQRKLGISTVFVTHDQDEAMAMSDRICVMESGVIRQIGSPSDIYERPRNRFVADFMGQSNLIEAQVRGIDNEDLVVDSNGLQLRSRQIDMKDAVEVVVMIRPERIAITRAERDGDSGRNNGASGQIANAVYLGSQMQYDIELTTGHSVQVTSQIENDFAREHFNPGESVTVTIPRDAVYVLGGA
jgi:ABC-type Fe3+/spermidine/putrescine transport system ATPase subunit